VINCTLKYALHYIIFSLTCRLRIAYLINLKNLICVDIVKCQVKFCLLLDFSHNILTNLVSTGGPHEISRRAVGWTHCPSKWLFSNVPGDGVYIVNRRRPSRTDARYNPWYNKLKGSCCDQKIINSKYQGLVQRFSTFIVLWPLDDKSKVLATPNNLKFFLGHIKGIYI